MFFMLLCINLFVQHVASIRWDRIPCSADGEQRVPEGVIEDIGRFPWLGFVQHNFVMLGKVKFAVTAGVLIHPGYAIAPAEDIAKIPSSIVANNTKFIVWKSNSLKYSIDVIDYVLHPDYTNKITLATIALLELDTQGETGASDFMNPVLPVCLPIKGAGVYGNLYVVKMTDVRGQPGKEVFKMTFVDNKDCDEFYERAQLGFGVRGPGCGTPAKFINIHDFLPWVNDLISRIPFEDREGAETIIGFRRLSPIKLIMYKGDKQLPKNIGQCKRGRRGSVLYKDNSEILTDKNFAQGFFFLEVSMIAMFYCVVVSLEDLQSRTNAAVWIEHHCHRDVTGAPAYDGVDLRKLECFVYFKSTATVEFRFRFSFKAILEITVFGTARKEDEYIPNPFKKKESTINWWPTAKNLRWGNFVPFYVWWYWL